MGIVTVVCWFKESRQMAFIIGKVEWALKLVINADVRHNSLRALGWSETRISCMNGNVYSTRFLFLFLLNSKHMEFHCYSIVHDLGLQFLRIPVQYCRRWSVDYAKSICCKKKMNKATALVCIGTRKIWRTFSGWIIVNSRRVVRPMTLFTNVAGSFLHSWKRVPTLPFVNP